MIKMEDEMSFDLPLQTLWDFINDKETIAACIPTLKSYRILDDDHVEGMVSVMLGVLPVESRVSMTVLKRTPPTEIQATGFSYLGEALAKPALDGQPPSELKDSVGKFQVTLRLVPLGPERTQAKVKVEVQAEGKLKRIYDMILERKLPALKSEFEQKIRAAIAARVQSIPQPGIQPPQPLVPERVSYSWAGAWIGRLIQLANRLLERLS